MDNEVQETIAKGCITAVIVTIALAFKLAAIAALVYIIIYLVKLMW